MLNKMVRVGLWGTVIIGTVVGGSTVKVDVQGTVNDSNSQAIQGAVVHLVKLNMWDTTDGSGAFSFAADIPASMKWRPLSQVYSAPCIQGGRICFSIVKKSEKVAIQLMDMRGRVVFDMLDKELPIGSYTMPISGKAVMAGQIYCASIAVGNAKTMMKTVAVESRVFSGGQKNVLSVPVGPGLSKGQSAAAAIDTILIKKLGFVNLSVPITGYESQLGMQKVRSSTVVAAAAKAPMHFIMTSTGSNSAGLSKRLLRTRTTAFTDSFMYPIKRWVGSKQWTGCPAFLELTVKKIVAYGLWNKSIVSKDTTKAASDSVVTKIDTLSEKGYEVLWEGTKKVRFTGSAANLSGFDSLKVPSGTIYSVTVYSDPFGLIKGSMTANFITGSTWDDTATKTYYTKAAYPWNGYAHTGGSTDASVFETGPAESTSVILNSSNDPNNGGPGFGIQTSCTTAVKDSITLTMLLDISRTLFFVLKDTSRFYADAAFMGDAAGNMGISAVFPGKCGRVDGYQYIYVTNNDQGSINADSSASPLRCDTTLGFTGWMNFVYDNSGKLIVANGQRDNDGSFGPWGCLSNYDTVSGNFHMGSTAAGAGQSQIFGFRPAAAVGDSCVTRVYQPAMVVGDGSTSLKRSGQAKFILKIRQQ
jgi:hypothetical protein